MRDTSQPDTDIDPGTEGENVEDTGGQRNVFSTTGVATDYFVPSSYRPYQRETIEEIERAFEQGYKYVVVDAPTGAGKSHIGAALAFESQNAHVLTIQKLLQDQYQDDFPGKMFIMKGRGAYTCLRGKDGDSCAEGPCRLKKSDPCPGCPYNDAKYAAITSDVVVHNFDSFYYQNSFGKGFGQRKLMIVDEAHNISNKFSGFLSFTIDSRGGLQVPECDRISDYDHFVHDAYFELSGEMGYLTDEYETFGLNKARLKRMNDLSMILHKLKRYITERERDDPEEYVFDYVNYGRYAPKVTFRPVFVGRYASRWLFGYADKVLMMSATILDKTMFCRETGLDPDETYYVSVPSIFPAKNRPIIRKYAGPMNFKQIKFTLPRIAEVVQEIADTYPNKKGIVQTHSEKIATYLQNNLIDDRFTYNKDYDTPKEMLAVHMAKHGSIIIASGLREGLDLRGELSQIQVFCKVPYPGMGDKLVLRKMELDADWYGWMTTLMFVQSLGRSVRSPTEKAVTFILDSGFNAFCKRYWKFIPKYIKEALK